MKHNTTSIPTVRVAEMPEFRFENSLEQVSLLDSKTAKRIFDLIHEKDAANANVEVTIEYHNVDDAFDIFRGQSAKLCLDAWTIYKDVTKAVGWSDEVLSDRDLKRMQCEVARLKNLRKEQASFNEQFFTDTSPG